MQEVGNHCVGGQREDGGYGDGGGGGVEEEEEEGDGELSSERQKLRVE